MKSDAGSKKWRFQSVNKCFSTICTHTNPNSARIRRKESRMRRHLAPAPQNHEVELWSPSNGLLIKYPKQSSYGSCRKLLNACSMLQSRFGCTSGHTFSLCLLKVRSSLRWYRACGLRMSFEAALTQERISGWARPETTGETNRAQNKVMACRKTSKRKLTLTKRTCVKHCEIDVRDSRDCTTGLKGKLYPRQPPERCLLASLLTPNTSVIEVLSLSLLAQPQPRDQISEALN